MEGFMKPIPTEFDKNITLQEALFYGFFILLSLAKGMGFYEGQKVFILLTAPALVMGFLKLLLTPYTKREAVSQILLFMLTAAVYFASRDVAVLFVMFTVLGMKGISVKKTLHIALWVWACCAVVLSIFLFPAGAHGIPGACQDGAGAYFSLESGLYPPEYSAYHLSDAVCADNS